MLVPLQWCVHTVTEMCAHLLCMCNADCGMHTNAVQCTLRAILIPRHHAMLCMPVHFIKIYCLQMQVKKPFSPDMCESPFFLLSLPFFFFLYHFGCYNMPFGSIVCIGTMTGMYSTFAEATKKKKIIIMRMQSLRIMSEMRRQ